MAPSHVALPQRLQRLTGSFAATKSNSDSHSHLIHPLYIVCLGFPDSSDFFDLLILLIAIKSTDTFSCVFSFPIC